MGHNNLRAGGNQSYQKQDLQSSYGGCGRGTRANFIPDFSEASTAPSTPNPYQQSSYSQKQPSTIYVGNLSAYTDRNSLSGAFSDMQLDVRKVNILLNDQGISKGAGFVTFGSADEAQSIVDKCQHQALTVEGNRLIVQMARQ